MVRRLPCETPVASQPANQSKRFSARRRRGIRTVAVFGGGLCLLVVLVLFALQSGPARRFAVTRLTAFLAEQHIDLQTDELRFSLFSLALDARNVRLRSSGASELPPFATIGRVQLDLSLADLLRGRYVVDSGVIENVDVQYIVDVDGRDNLPRLPAKSRQDRATARLPRQELVGAERATPLREPNPAAGRGTLARAGTDDRQCDHRTPPNPISRVPGGQIQIENHLEHIGHVSGAIDLGRDDLRVDLLRFEVAGSRAELAGDVRDFDAPQLALELQATIDAARSSMLLGMRDPLAGAVVVAANANGPLSGPAIGARVSASALQFRSLSIGQVDARATYDDATRRVDVSSALIQAPWGRLSASGILALGRERRSRLHAELTGVDTATVMRGLNLPYVADSRADGKLDAEWPGLEYLKASGAGAVTLAPGNATVARRTIPVGGRLSMRSNAGKVVADLQQIAAAGAQVVGHVEIDDGHLQGQVHASVLDVEPTSAAVETFLGQPKGSLLPVAVKGAATIEARLAGTVNQPTGHVNVNAPSLSVEETRWRSHRRRADVHTCRGQRHPRGRQMGRCARRRHRNGRVVWRSQGRSRYRC